MKRAVINSNSVLIKWEKNDGRIFNGILRLVGEYKFDRNTKINRSNRSIKTLSRHDLPNYKFRRKEFYRRIGIPSLAFDDLPRYIR